jgi:hypothetical protein
LGAVLVFLCGALALASAFAGCGGDDAGGEVTITRAKFIERANAVCLETRREISAEFASYGESRVAKEAERAQRANELSADEANEAAAKVAERILIPAMRTQLEELRELGTPSEDGDRARAMLDAFDEGLEKAEARPERAARDGTEAFGRAGRLADEYGIANC